jgi:hypothetical protein
MMEYWNEKPFAVQKAQEGERVLPLSPLYDAE